VVRGRLILGGVQGLVVARWSGYLDYDPDAATLTLRTLPL
jgi:hypothetical protein